MRFRADPTLFAPRFQRSPGAPINSFNTVFALAKIILERVVAPIGNEPNADRFALPK